MIGHWAHCIPAGVGMTHGPAKDLQQAKRPRQIGHIKLQTKDFVAYNLYSQLLSVDSPDES